MNKTAISVAVSLTIVLLAACQTAERRFMPLTAVQLECPNKCDVPLIVTDAGALDIKFDPLIVTKPNTKIIWQAPAGYEFRRTDAVLLKDPDDDEDDPQFEKKYVSDSNGNKTGNPKGEYFHWRDKKSKNKDFKYEIRVYKLHSMDPPLILDPTIKNQG